MLSITALHIHKVLTYSILFLLILFFIGSLEFMPDVYFSNRPMLDLPAWVEELWNYIPWIILALSSLDILLKYKKVGNLRLLLRIHWIDIIMIALIPFLFIFKVAKISLKVYKIVKTGKSWSKLSHLIKKILLLGRSPKNKSTSPAYLL